MKTNIPGRVITFYEGGGAYADYSAALRRGDTPTETRDLGADEIALFSAVDAGRSVRPSKGGFYVIADLTPPAIAAACYWAETLATASGDELEEPDNYNDHRAALRLLAKLEAVR